MTVLHYGVVSENRTKFQSKAFGGGQLAARPPQFWPAGVCHAVLPGTFVTLCGQPASDFWQFHEVGFDRPNLTKCTTCLERAE